MLPYIFLLVNGPKKLNVGKKLNPTQMQAQASVFPSQTANCIKHEEFQIIF